MASMASLTYKIYDEFRLTVLVSFSEHQGICNTCAFLVYTGKVITPYISKHIVIARVPQYWSWCTSSRLMENSFMGASIWNETRAPTLDNGYYGYWRGQSGTTFTDIKCCYWWHLINDEKLLETFAIIAILHYNANMGQYKYFGVWLLTCQHTRLTYT